MGHANLYFKPNTQPFRPVQSTLRCTLGQPKAQVGELIYLRLGLFNILMIQMVENNLNHSLKLVLSADLNKNWTVLLILASKKVESQGR